MIRFAEAMVGETEMEKSKISDKGVSQMVRSLSYEYIHKKNIGRRMIRN